jgi:hypothetical protein
LSSVFWRNFSVLPKLVFDGVPPDWPLQNARKKTWKSYGKAIVQGNNDPERSHVNVARYWLSRQEHHKAVIVLFSGVDNNTSFPCVCQGVLFGFFQQVDVFQTVPKRLSPTASRIISQRIRSVKGVLAPIFLY